jgi:hypothetical protein
MEPKQPVSQLAKDSLLLYHHNLILTGISFLPGKNYSRIYMKYCRVSSHSCCKKNKQEFEKDKHINKVLLKDLLQ